RTCGMGEDRLPTSAMSGRSGPLVNDEELTARLAAALAGPLGADNVVTDFPPATGSEDCHLLAGPHHDLPVAYLLVGVADPEVFAAAAAAGKLFPYAPHSPQYRVDLAAIGLGATGASYALRELFTGKPLGQPQERPGRSAPAPRWTLMARAGHSSAAFCTASAYSSGTATGPTVGPFSPMRVTRSSSRANTAQARR